MIAHDDDIVMNIRFHNNGTVSVYSDCCKAWHTTVNGTPEAFEASAYALGLQGIGHSWTDEEATIQQLPDLGGYGEQLSGFLRDIATGALEASGNWPPRDAVSATIAADRAIESLGGIDAMLKDAMERTTQDQDEGDSGWFTPTIDLSEQPQEESS